jgi:hypothetical protein
MGLLYYRTRFWFFRHRFKFRFWSNAIDYCRPECDSLISSSVYTAYASVLLALSHSRAIPRKFIGRFFFLEEQSAVLPSGYATLQCSIISSAQPLRHSEYNVSHSLTHTMCLNHSLTPRVPAVCNSAKGDDKRNIITDCDQHKMAPQLALMLLR